MKEIVHVQNLKCDTYNDQTIKSLTTFIFVLLEFG